MFWRTVVGAAGAMALCYTAVVFIGDKYGWGRHELMRRRRRRVVAPDALWTMLPSKEVAALRPFFDQEYASARDPVTNDVTILYFCIFNGVYVCSQTVGIREVQRWIDPKGRFQRLQTITLFQNPWHDWHRATVTSVTRFALQRMARKWITRTKLRIWARVHWSRSAVIHRDLVDLVVDFF